MTVKRMGMLVVSVKKMQALTVKMRQNLTLCVLKAGNEQQIFFSSRYFIFGGDLDLDEYILLWHTFFWQVALD
jgi:hypothetical protein